MSTLYRAFASDGELLYIGVRVAARVEAKKSAA